MGSLGVFFAVTPEQASALRDATDDDEIMELVGAIEEAWDTDNLAPCDKAWDALHRLLTDGLLASITREWFDDRYRTVVPHDVRNRGQWSRVTAMALVSRA